MSLTVGRISYLNAVPYFHHLRDTGFAGTVVEGVPAELNRRLAAGELDLSPSSSFEYARQWRDYLLLPGHSISSRGAVQSVLLFSREPLEEVAAAPIAVTGESATSVNLLKVLLREYCGASEVISRVPDEPVEEVIAGGGSALLIGDRALRMGKVARNCNVYDLGELWQRFTGLPFVFGLWIVRRSSFRMQRAAIQLFREQLDLALELALGNLEAMAAEVAPGSPLESDELAAYWRTVSYALTPEHLRGLKLFFSLCCRYGLLAGEPEIVFAD